MKVKVLIIFVINLIFLTGGIRQAFAMEHVQKNGLFSMDIPEQWNWFDNAQEVVVSFPDGKTMAIDIQLAPSKLSQTEVKKAIQDSDNKMIKDGIEAHQATLIDNKEVKVDGVYAKQLDFKTAPPNPVYVTYISLFNKGYAFTITYGSSDEKMRLMMDDAVATFKFK